MIENFVKAWDKNKGKLEDYFKVNPQQCYNTYESLVAILFSEVINPYLNEIGEEVFDVTKLHVIDDGSYQGSLLFIIPEDSYQPAPFQYVWTNQYYGSCSGCDELLAISRYDEDVTPDNEQLKDYMNLSLHLLQRCKYMIDRETHYNED